MALLGFAAGGAALALSPRLKRMEEGPFATLCLGGFGLAALLAAWGAGGIQADALALIRSLREGDWLPAASAYGPLLLLTASPFPFLGLFLGRALSRDGGLYPANLAGTAAGVPLFLLLFQPLGAFGFIAVLAAGAALLGLRLGGSRLLLALLPAAGALCLATPEVDRSKQIHPLYPGQVLETAWTPLFRVDLVKTPNAAMITIDGDAKTPVFLPGKLLDASAQEGRDLGFRLVPEGERRSALVLGAGGGTDVLAARNAGFLRIDAVDIDPVRMDWLRNRHRDLNGGLYRMPGVSPIVADGRAWVRAHRSRYDAIGVYNVDSVTGLTIGAYSLVESSLYTQEAVLDYVDALVPGGVLHISRPAWGGAPETYRMFHTLVSAALARGLDPAGHLLVVRHPWQVHFLLSKRPLRKEALAGTGVLLYGPDGGEEAFRLLALRIADGTVDALYPRLPGDIRPATDDRPFFFEFGTYRRSGLLPETPYNNWSHPLLSAALWVATLSVAGLLLVCALRMEARPRPGLLLPPLLYFSAIGFGYMLVQTALVQRLALPLGHPVRALALVIPTLLVSMGAGAMLSALAGIRPGRAAGLSALALLVFEVLVAPFLKEAGWAGIVSSLAGLGLCLGCCFPAGWSRLPAGMAPLAWTANAGFSVLGSLAALVLSLLFGFHATVLAGAGCYAAAWLAARRSAPSGSA